MRNSDLGSESLGACLLLSLPEDVIAVIARFVYPRDICNLSLCCKSLCDVVDSEWIWLVQCEVVKVLPLSEIIQWRVEITSYKALCRFLVDVLKPLAGIWVHQNPELGDVVYVIPGFLSVVGCRIIPQEVGPLGIEEARVMWSPVFEIICSTDGSAKFFLHGRYVKLHCCLHPGFVMGTEKSCNVLLLEVEPRREKKLCSEIEDCVVGRDRDDKIYKLCGSTPDSFWKRTKLPHATSFKPQHTYEATLRERCIELSTSGVFLLETLLSMEPDKRGTASSALNSEYFLTRPYACDPSSLPKYPPNKEMDAKYHDDIRRKRANLKLRDSGVGRKHKRPHRTEYDPKNYAKLPIRQDTLEVKNEASRATTTTQGNYYKVSDLPMTTGPASGFAWAVKRRKDPDNISTLTYYQPSSRSQLSGTSVAFAKNTFGLNLKPDNDSVWEVQGDNYDEVIEEVPSESKLSRIGERHGSLDGSGLDFSQREEDSPKKNLEHLQFGKQSISGPLKFKSGKIDEILQRNESNIRQAVRKSHFQREQDDR